MSDPVERMIERQRTQRALVLDLLRAAGSQGVPSSVLFAAPYYVMRAASRIDELRRAGYRIETRFGPGRMAVYVLEGGGAPPSPSPSISARSLTFGLDTPCSHCHGDRAKAPTCRRCEGRGFIAAEQDRASSEARDF